MSAGRMIPTVCCFTMAQVRRIVVENLQPLSNLPGNLPPVFKVPDAIRRREDLITCPIRGLYAG